MTSPNPLLSVSPSQAITKITMMYQGARIIMLALFGAGAGLLFLLATHPANSTRLIFGAVHAFQMGVTMLVVVGALSGHRAIMEQQHRTQELIARHDQRVLELRELHTLTRRDVDELRQLERRILAIAASDDLADRRRNNHHN